MSLTKSYDLTFHPAVAEVPYVAAYTVCQSVDPGGYWNYQCTKDDVTEQFSSGGVALKAPEYLLVSYSDGTVLIMSWSGTTAVAAGSSGTTSSLVSAIKYTCASVWVSYPSSGEVACTSYPEQAAVSGRAAYIEMSASAQWNAGANSVESQDGDCEVTFSMGLVVGVLVGLITDPDGDVTSVDRMSHALYFHQDASGTPQFSVVEAGSTLRAAARYAPGDVWAIRRAGKQVGYFRNGQRVMLSSNPSSGTVHVGSALFYSGDEIE